jgi:hypothetical protein
MNLPVCTCGSTISVNEKVPFVQRVRQSRVIYRRLLLFRIFRMKMGENLKNNFLLRKKSVLKLNAWTREVHATLQKTKKKKLAFFVCRKQRL